MAASSTSKADYQLLYRKGSTDHREGSLDLGSTHQEHALDPDASAGVEDSDSDLDLEELDLLATKQSDADAIGAARIASITAVWTSRSKACFMLCLGVMVIVYSFASTTTRGYITYALSDFENLSKQGTFDVANAVISASWKLPVAKISDVLGRAETYCILLILDSSAQFVRAVSPNMGVFTLGYILYIAGHGGFSILDMILISDVTSMRMRGLAGTAIYFPFLVTPWLAGIIVDKVMDSVGWRWGYGMFTFIVPLGTAPLVATLFYLQRKAIQKGIAVRTRLTAREFCSQVDLQGLLLLCGGFALVLLPLTLLSQAKGAHGMLDWHWILVAVGSALLACFVYHERFNALHPVVPMRYFKNKAIVCTFLLGAFDSMGFAGTHTYLFPWSVAAHNYSPKKAMYLNYTNGVTMCFAAIVTGAVMYRIRSYKRMVFVASAIRLAGYALMLRLRSADSSDFELFLVQMIQGAGSGIVETAVYVAGQITVPHAELAQVTALTSLGGRLGDAVGAAIAGGIYTKNMKGRLRTRLGDGVSNEEIDKLFDSVTGQTLPDWGTAKRTAVAAAYSDVMGYITIAAFVISIPIVVFAFFLPDNKLGDGKNLVSDSKAPEELDNVPMRRAKVSR